MSSSARLLESVDALVACKDLEELASSAALLAQRLLGGAEAVVFLRSTEHEVASPAAIGSGKLGTWAAGLLATLPHRQLSSSGSLRAVGVEPLETGLRGVLALSLEPRSGSGAASESAEQDSAEQEALLVALADLIASCSAQTVRRLQADRTLQDTRALVAQGLHDLCTPLNSLRLGMHLLEPALTTKDPAVAQRTHRAVDRMAAMVTQMADAIGHGRSSPQTS